MEQFVNLETVAKSKDVILYGNKNFDDNMNISILTATIKFIKDSERFDQPLF